jgi:DNA-binding NarL/FixJ family response regulator
MVKIVLLDQQQLFLDTFERALRQDAPSITVVGAVGSARDACDLAENELADLIVTDLLLFETDAVSVARDLVRRRSSTGLFVLTMETNRAFVAEALEAGVRGYALKTQRFSEVITAITGAAHGARYLAPSLGGQLRRAGPRGVMPEKIRAC